MKGGGILKDFRPPSADGFGVISEESPLLIFQMLENNPPLVSSDPDGLFSNISPDDSVAVVLFREGEGLL